MRYKSHRGPDEISIQPDRGYVYMPSVFSKRSFFTFTYTDRGTIAQFSFFFFIYINTSVYISSFSN